MAPLRLISCIVPVLDEAGVVGDCVRAVRALPGRWEVIVVDGGSSDRTVEEARDAGADAVLPAPPGRGAQLRAGAAAASADLLLFLHADARLPASAARHVVATLEDPRWSGGAFRLRHDRRGLSTAAALALALSDLRSWIARIPYGDQAVFTRRDLYERAGGFPDQPLMEDIELGRRLRRIGPIRRVPAVVTVSGRRFLRRPLHTSLCWNLFPTLYRLGVAPERLARWYGCGATR